MNKKIRFYISPFFLSRYYLLRDIKEIVKKYKFNGETLDVGCGEKPYQHLFKNGSYKGIDFRSYSKNKDFKGSPPDLYFNGDYLKTLRLPVEDESFDNIVCFQVLEHYPNPQKLISECYRALKKRGLLLLTFPFLEGLHEEPLDYQRITKFGTVALLNQSNFEILEYKEEGSLFSTISILLNGYLNYFASKNMLTYFISVLIYLPFLIFQYLCLVLDKVFISKQIYINNLVLGRKK